MSLGLNLNECQITPVWLLSDPTLFQLPIRVTSKYKPPYRKTVKVTKTIAHPSYGKPKSKSNDISLLQLAENVDLSVHTPACLPAADKDFTGQTGAVYGEKDWIFVHFLISLTQDGGQQTPATLT